MKEILFVLKNPFQAIKLIYNKFYNTIKNKLGLDITNQGERCLMDYYNMNYDQLDMYQKSHYKRYEFAKTLLNRNDFVGDMSCGTGYGTAMLSESCYRTDGYDISNETILYDKKKYIPINNVSFFCEDLLTLHLDQIYDKIISFETVEHIEGKYTLRLFHNYHKALKKGGKLIFSVPYMQEESDIAKKMGFHKIFQINEETIRGRTNSTGFTLEKIYYQNYTSHNLQQNLNQKDFIICICTKNDN